MIDKDKQPNFDFFYKLKANQNNSVITDYKDIFYFSINSFIQHFSFWFILKIILLILIFPNQFYESLLPAYLLLYSFYSLSKIVCDHITSKPVSFYEPIKIAFTVGIIIASWEIVKLITWN